MLGSHKFFYTSYETVSITLDMFVIIVLKILAYINEAKCVFKRFNASKKGYAVCVRVHTIFLGYVGRGYPPSQDLFHNRRTQYPFLHIVFLITLLSLF